VLDEIYNLRSQKIVINPFGFIWDEELQFFPTMVTALILVEITEENTNSIIKNDTQL